MRLEALIELAGHSRPQIGKGWGHNGMHCYMERQQFPCAGDATHRDCHVHFERHKHRHMAPSGAAGGEAGTRSCRHCDKKLQQA